MKILTINNNCNSQNSLAFQKRVMVRNNNKIVHDFKTNWIQDFFISKVEGELSKINSIDPRTNLSEVIDENIDLVCAYLKKIMGKRKLPFTPQLEDTFSLADRRFSYTNADTKIEVSYS